MRNLQRYISAELTHFVGRGKKENEQYELLLTILKSGVLRPPEYGTEEEGFTWYPHGHRFSGNDMFCAGAVCFCDIPLGDLELHMAKYSRFGVSFGKKFLVPRGATPVFYVAKDALTQPLGGRGPREVTLAAIFDHAAAAFCASTDAMMKSPHQRSGEMGGSSMNAENGVEVLDEETSKEIAMRLFLMVHVFSFVKFFEGSRSDEDTENFYMEREWRVLGSVHFKLSDVERLILPRDYGKKIRQDLPEFGGQLTYL